MVETMSITQTEELEFNIKRSKEIIALGDSLNRLDTNADFKKVFKDGYFAAEAIRLVHLRSDPALQEPGVKAAILADIDSIGALASYLKTVRFLAQQARKALAVDEETLEEILAEELNNG
jgi:hypothetical protein